MALLSDVILRDTRANQPAANTVGAGTIYGVTDEGNILERSTGATWEPYSPVAGGTGDVSAVGTLTSNALVIGQGATDVAATSTAAGILTFVGTPSSANLAAALTDETGTGAAVFATTPTLVTPILGTPTSGTLTNCTGLPTAGLLDEAVTLAKMQDAAANDRLLGSGNSGAGTPYAEITVGTGLAMTGTTLSASGSTPALVLITETVTAASQASVTFSTITGTYRDLVVRVRGRGTNASANVSVLVRFNSDSGNNYNFGRYRFFGTTSSFTQATAQSSIDIGDLPAATATASYAGSVQVTVYDYRGTTFFKATQSEFGAPLSTGANNLGKGVVCGPVDQRIGHHDHPGVALGRQLRGQLGRESVRVAVRAYNGRRATCFVRKSQDRHQGRHHRRTSRRW